MNTIENTEKNIQQAIKDYWAHTNSTYIYDDISDKFIRRLAEDSTEAKQELRELFSKSPAWDDTLDALVINGTRTHNPDPELIFDLAYRILYPAYKSTLNPEKGIYISTFENAIHFFTRLNHKGYDPRDNIAAIKLLAPKAYTPNKKPSRIFKAICDALNITDDTAGSEFQRLYAQFADELTTKKIGFKLYVSLNPAHFLTMSNPKNDSRGSTLTSCHSFNSTEYEYNAGCTGYARDKWSFIAFTVSDTRIPETLNNRKTTRQIFAYKPGNGLLMQSRLYNTGGGTHGAQEESTLYRDLIQRELSDLEDVPNLWKTYPYLDGKEHCVEIGYGFGGYADWTYDGFDGKVSIRTDRKNDFESFTVGTSGLCICCACDNYHGLYCSNCRDGEDEICSECDERCSETHTVYDSRNNEISVCESCRDEYYRYCEHCEEYFHEDRIGYIQGVGNVCDDCRNEYYTCCSDCGDWYNSDDLYRVYNSDDDIDYICKDCLDENYSQCNRCGELVHNNRIVDAYDEERNGIVVCDDCRDRHFRECDKCGNIYDINVIENGLCPNCQGKAADKKEEIV